MPPHTKQEIEIKLCISHLPDMRHLLRRLRARRLRRVFESNTLFDTPGELFFRTGRLLRLRWVLPVGAARRVAPARQAPSEPAIAGRCVAPVPALITFKGRSKSSGRYKVREEAELQLPDADKAARLLRAAGLVPIFRYEKWRTSFRLPRLLGLHVELDETPIGAFFELEGPRRAIDRAARLLGYRPAHYITSSYWGLFQDFCHRRGLRTRDMVFRRQKK